MDPKATPDPNSYPDDYYEEEEEAVLPDDPNDPSTIAVNILSLIIFGGILIGVGIFIYWYRKIISPLSFFS